MRGNGALDHVLGALKGVGGYFVLRDETGEEFIIMRAADWQRRAGSDMQLPLPPLGARREGGPIASPVSLPAAGATEVLARINREIALYQLQQEEQAAEVVAEDADPARRLGGTERPGTRVRFEPLRGDLPPELQE